MRELTPTTQLARSPDVLFSPLADNEGVLLSMEAGLYFSLNKTAVVVWNALEKAKSLDELADLLAARFKVERTQAQADLETLLAQMVEKKLVVQQS